MKPLARQTIQAALTAREVRGVNGPDVTMIFTDTRRPAPGGLFVALCGDNFDGHDHLQTALHGGACGVVVSNPAALPSDLDADTFVVVVSDTREALGTLGHMVRRAHPGRFAAITGSVGKTTVKDMLRAALTDTGSVTASPGNWNNEIGVPLSLFSTQGDESFVVLELGMSGAGEIAALTKIAEPSVGLITAAAAAHLEFFESVDAIADAKAELWEHLPAKGRAVACADDARVLERATRLRPDGLVTYGEDQRADFRVLNVTQSAQGVSTTIAHPEGEVTVRLSGLGVHNAVNAAGAVAAATLLGVSPEQAARSLSAHFRPAAHRLIVHETASKAFVLDDCYNANPMSTKAALDTLAVVGNVDCGLGAVLGSMLELGERADGLHRDVGRHAAEAGVVWLAATGPHANALAEGAREGGVETIHVVDDAMELEEAVSTFTTDGRWLLLKGSRGGRLERLLPTLGIGEVS
jgi:UDP-N-acetylmuramoyl-tripeptide--D-alanyl-D-alanine ligase